MMEINEFINITQKVMRYENEPYTLKETYYYHTMRGGRAFHYGNSTPEQVLLAQEIMECIHNSIGETPMKWEYFQPYGAALTWTFYGHTIIHKEEQGVYTSEVVLEYVDHYDPAEWE